jgi:hypothetical protein
MDIVERQRLLKQHYMFKCQCSGCSSINFPDLVINSFRCQNSGCCGVILKNIALKILEKNSVQALVGTSLLSNLLLPVCPFLPYYSPNSLLNIHFFSPGCHTHNNPK